MSVQIRYWLPDMLKNEYIALRFVAQDAYEQAAQLRIAPVPDVVTRVFMLFRGVPVGDLGLWNETLCGVSLTMPCHFLSFPVTQGLYFFFPS